MKIEIQKAALLGAIVYASKIMRRKQPSEILNAARVTASGDKMTVYADDMAGIVGLMTLPVKVIQPGEFAAIPGVLIDKIQAMPDGAITLETTDKHVVLSCASKRKFQTSILSAKDLPPMKSMTPEGSSKIRGSELKAALTRTIWAMATENSKPNLYGVCIEPQKDGKAVRMSSTNGRAMSFVDFVCEGLTQKEYILHADSAKLLRDVAGQYEELSISLGEAIHVGHGDMQLRFSPVDSQFVQTSAIMPHFDPGSLSVRVDRAAFLDAVKAVSVAGGTVGKMVMNFGDNVIDLSLGGKDVSARDSVDATVSGEPMEVRVAPEYMISAIESLDAPQIQFELRDPLAPVAIMGSNVRIIVMPMHRDA